MSDQKEIVLVTKREAFVASAKHNLIKTFSDILASVYELPSGVFQDLEFSGYKRPECEKNYNFIQMIPYIILRDIHPDTGEVKYLTYKRGKAGAEGKLHDKYSIGVGGHISVNDHVDSLLTTDLVYIKHDSNPVDIVVAEMIKEVQQEVGLDLTKHFSNEDLRIMVTRAKCFYINEGPESVNSYHFALPIAINVNYFADQLISNEPGVIEKVSFKTLDELKVIADQLEPWSSVVLLNYLPPVITPEVYLNATGCPAIQDDIERANCSKAGSGGHTACGWCVENHVPNTFASAAINRKQA